MLGFGEWPCLKPVVVMSRSLTDAQVPGHLQGKVRISLKEPAALMAELEAKADHVPMWPAAIWCSPSCGRV